MTTTPIVIERHSKVAPLGVRFWDEIAHKSIGDSLIVTAYRATQPDRRFALTLNRANVFVLQNVPGLRDIEFGAGDQDYWDNLPAPQSFVIDVFDTANRFLPFTFTAAVPTRDLYEWICGSPPEQSGVPLFSTPTRSNPGGYGVIRAELRDEAQFDTRTQDYAPASWALLEAWYDGQRVGRGLADQQGRIVVFLPYPEPINPPISSPPTPRTALTSQVWPIELRAFYSPLVPVPQSPDLCAALTQSPATLLNALSPPTPLTQVHVAYGVDAIVKTVGRSDLLIS
jgi:hypothetical protein